MRPCPPGFAPLCSHNLFNGMGKVWVLTVSIISASVLGFIREKACRRAAGFGNPGTCPAERVLVSYQAAELHREGIALIAVHIVKTSRASLMSIHVQHLAEKVQAEFKVATTPALGHSSGMCSQHYHRQIESLAFAASWHMFHPGSAYLMPALLPKLLCTSLGCHIGSTRQMV